MSSNPIVIRDHSGFHRQVLRLCVAGAGLGLGIFLVGESIAPGASAWSAAVHWLAIVLLGLTANPPQKPARLGSVIGALVVGGLAAGSMHALAQGPRAYPWFAVALGGAAVGLIAARGLKDHRRYLVPMASAGSITLAFWVAGTFAVRIPLHEYVPSFIGASLAGGVFGFVASMGLLLLQVERDQDEVAQRYSDIKPTLSGEMEEIVDRSVRAYRRVKEDVVRREDKSEAEQQILEGVEGIIARVFDLAQRWERIDGRARGTDASKLQKRVEELDKKITGADDAVARYEYQQARDALKAQLTYLNRIDQSRERVLARVHNYLATLERVHLAVLNHRGADTAKFSDELAPLIGELEDIGSEMDFASEAIHEAAEAAVSDPQPAEAGAKNEARKPSPEPQDHIAAGVADGLLASPINVPLGPNGADDPLS